MSVWNLCQFWINICQFRIYVNSELTYVSLELYDTEMLDILWYKLSKL